ncbi:MAG: hypothetical protein EXR47_07890 [Dehalococcoidia bacterium]|nr:hypothetical protein [Dehalococcoidia bacterium]
MEEALAAGVGMTALGAAVALLSWGLTGLSPWPGLVLGEVAGFGTVLLAMASPRRRRQARRLGGSPAATRIMNKG